MTSRAPEEVDEGDGRLGGPDGGLVNCFWRLKNAYGRLGMRILNRAGREWRWTHRGEMERMSEGVLEIMERGGRG